VSRDDDLARELKARGLRRAAEFSWARSAQTLLSELRIAAGSRRPVLAG
jgi:hypothetical protein